jgi:hypothetical protein
LAAYQLEKAKAHPMAVEWHELMQAVDNSEKAGKLLLPERSLFLLDFLVRLRGLLDLSGIERVLKKLESAGDYFSTVFEIFTLSAYRQIGANIEIVSESTQPNERRADFLVRGKPDCYVECKSLEDLSRREERLWEQVEGRVVKVLLKHRRSWRVIIRAKRALKGNDIADILAVITSRVKAEDINPVRIADGQMDIEFQIYTIMPDVWLPGGQDAIKTSSPRGLWECESATDAEGKSIHRNAVIVEVDPFIKVDETGRILDDISDAHGQIPEGACGIVHVEVPFRKGPRLLEVCDLAYQRTFGLLRRKGRLNAAVLSGRTMEPNMKKGGNTFADYYAIIPSPGPKTALAQEMFVLGSTPRGAAVSGLIKKSLMDDVRWWGRLIWMRLTGKIKMLPQNVSQPADFGKIGSNREGSIILHFGIYEPLPQQIGKSLIHFCSRDGTRQVRLWQSFENHFRADIVYPSFGRRTFKGDLNDLGVGVTHKLGIGWSANGISVAVNGEMLEPIV